MAEEISLLALPPGRHYQADGSIWEVGRFDLSGTKEWLPVNFTVPFSAPPHLFLTLQTANEPDVVTVRAKAVTESGFEAALFEQESYQNGHDFEVVGYVAIYSPTASGSVTFAGIKLDYQLSQLELNSDWKVVDDQSLAFQEEQSGDQETDHWWETVHLLRFADHIFTQDVTSAGLNTTAIRRQGETPTIFHQGLDLPDQTVYYAYNDHLGAVSKLTDETGQVVWDADRLPFGQLNIVTAAVDLPLRFPGQYYDDESGLYYNYYRDYDPSTGRYIQSDPIGLDGGLNTYAYALSNPLRWIDIDGLSPQGERGATSGASGQNTNNPNKKCRELVPPDPRFVECKHHQTGKWIKKPRPAGMPFPGNNSNRSNSMQCGETCQKVLVGVRDAVTGVIIFTWVCITAPFAS